MSKQIRCLLVLALPSCFQQSCFNGLNHGGMSLMHRYNEANKQDTKNRLFDQMVVRNRAHSLETIGCLCTNTMPKLSHGEPLSIDKFRI